MAFAESRRRPMCPACAGPTNAPGLCRECAEAFALARRVHPAAASPSGFGGASDPAVGDDLDMWDEWSLLGDVGGRALKCVAD